MLYLSVSHFESVYQGCRQRVCRQMVLLARLVTPFTLTRVVQVRHERTKYQSNYVTEIV